MFQQVTITAATLTGSVQLFRIYLPVCLNCLVEQTCAEDINSNGNENDLTSQGRQLAFNETIFVNIMQRLFYLRFKVGEGASKFLDDFKTFKYLKEI